MLGGTSTLGDCLVALRYLLHPFGLLEGPVIREYENAFARRIGVRSAFCFSSGRVGFYGLLRSLGIGPGAEVLVQVPTHIVIPNAIRYTGARPVYVDCQRENYNMDLEAAEQQITPRAKVLLLQHTFGIPADVDRALDLARRCNLILIEDCVHALGALYKGKPVGSFGRAAFFSTEETKTISSTMGGVVVTDDPELSDRMREFQAECALPLRWLTARYLIKFVAYHLLSEPHVHRFARVIYEAFGRRNPLPHATTPEECQGMRPPRYEQRFSNAQAALALRQMERVDAILTHRAEIADLYRQKLCNLGIVPPHLPAGARPAFVRYPLWVNNREQAVRAAAPHAMLGTWFTSVLEEAASPSCVDYVDGSCPVAESVAQCLVNLPTHMRVLPQDVAAILSALKPFLARGSLSKDQEKVMPGLSRHTRSLAC